MKLEVKEQVHLSPKRMLEICLDSIRYRLMRSVVTVVIIVLAIAFLAHIMAEGYFGRAARDAAIARTRTLTAYTKFLSRISHVESDEKLALSFAQIREGSADFANLHGWGGFDANEANDFIARSRSVERYLRFFEELPVGRRVLLVEHHTGFAMFDWLADESHQQQFTARLAEMKSLKLPGGSEELKQFLSAWPAYRASLATIRQNYGDTIARIGGYVGAEGAAARLSMADFFPQLAALGFAVDPEQAKDILRGREYQQQVDWALAHLKKQPVRAGWEREFQEKFNPTSALKSCAGAPGRVDWIERVLEQASVAADFDREKFRRVAADYRAQANLLAAQQELLNRYGEERGLSRRTVWLIVVSFLVCVVGIANAMLMSVLERFKEIATMKCLGARNQTIAFLFVTESVIIGVLGGLVGIGIGVLIALARQVSAHGSLLFDKFPTADLVTTLVTCFLCSLLLAAIAAIYPAGVAARMQPMEAMRVD